MTRRWPIAVLFLSVEAHGQRATAGTPPLPALPTMPRVRIEAARDHVVVIEDINLGRGDWQGRDLDLFVAFGAPGTPRAVDARIFAADVSGSPSAADAVGEAVSVAPAAKRPAAASTLLGPPQMSGVVLHISAAEFRRAVSGGSRAQIRVRSLLDFPAEDTEGGHELVVRLGVAGGPPLVLGALELASLEPHPWITRAEAHLCGAEADPYPLAIKIHPAPPVPPVPPWPGPAAPQLLPRHTSDDLCVRFWVSPG